MCIAVRKTLVAGEQVYVIYAQSFDAQRQAIQKKAEKRAKEAGETSNALMQPGLMKSDAVFIPKQLAIVPLIASNIFE